MFNLFKKKEPHICFFCKTFLTKDTEYTIQYTSLEGVHTEKTCQQCAAVFDEIIALREEANNYYE